MKQTQMSELSVEEAITHIKAACKIAINAGYNSVVVDACAMAVEALKQEPCEDAISRQAVLILPRKTMKNYFGEIIDEVISVKDIQALPSVTPAEKVGHWIDVQGLFFCSECDDGFGEVFHWNYCPNCGAKMEVVSG